MKQKFLLFYRIPTYDEIVNDDDDEEQLEKERQFERKYNFRYEEPDQEFVSTYWISRNISLPNLHISTSDKNSIFITFSFYRSNNIHEQLMNRYDDLMIDAKLNAIRIKNAKRR
jgi:hypothetical protein